MGGSSVGYLVDLFSTMNEVILSLQGKQLAVFVSSDKILGFKQKLEFWKICNNELGISQVKDFFLGVLWSREQRALRFV